MSVWVNGETTALNIDHHTLVQLIHQTRQRNNNTDPKQIILGFHYLLKLMKFFEVHQTSTSKEVV